MKRRLLSLMGVLTIVVAVAYVARPVGHIPPYDANLVRLAESELQGYCAGEAFWKSQGQGDAGLAASCRNRRSAALSDDPDLAKVERPFCLAIVAGGWEGTVAQCLEIMSVFKYWPTYDGSITDQWNRARPYPRSAIQGPGGAPQDDSRTGGHGQIGRGSGPP